MDYLVIDYLESTVIDKLIGFPMIDFIDWLPTVDNTRKLKYEAQLTYS